MNRTRRIATGLLVALGILCVSLFIVAWWISQTFLNTARFQAAIESTLASPQITAPFAASFEDSLAARLPAGSATATQLTEAVDTTLRDPAFQAKAASVTAAYLEAATTAGPHTQPTLSLQEFRPSLERALADVAPQAAAGLPADLGSVTLPPIADVPSVAEPASLARAAPPYLLGIGISLLALAMVVTVDRPRTMRRIGIRLLVISLLPLALRLLTPWLIPLLVPAADGAIRPFVATATSDLLVDWIRAALWVAAAGIVVTGASLLWLRRTAQAATPA